MKKMTMKCAKPINGSTTFIGCGRENPRPKVSTERAVRKFC